MIAKLFWIGVAGAAGTLARYGLGGWVQAGTKGVFPLGTLAVNLLGCLAFGVVVSVMERWAGHAELRSILLIGFMGAFTTFSTFMFETGELTRDGQWLWAMGNLAAQNVLGLAAVIAGLALGRMV
ncbi:MAG: fluoride efflux transporter CrcB [Pirellulales bacterium]|nr:fluoride efflux transporter CrcB [Pirellulales bacterium]